MRAHIFASLLLALVSASCASETGIIISTSGSGDFDGDIATLRYYVGTDNLINSTGFSDNDPADDIDPEKDIVNDSPYRLLLRPKNDNQQEIKVAAISFNERGEINGFGQVDPMLEFVQGSVLQWDLVIGPVPSHVVVTDTGCLQWIDEGGALVVIGLGGDQDCDGVSEPEDCDDFDPTISPDVAEICDNGIDDNCNDLADDEDNVDSDNDGFSACGTDNGGDCNDNNRLINPNAAEACDAVDNNCNGECDELFDADEDGISSCGSNIVRDGNDGSFCQYIGPDDCNDGDALIFPGAPELCDGVDNNCDNGCDDEFVFDADGDGYTTCGDGKGTVVGSCWGADILWNDCNDNNNYVHPGKHEYCDGIDNNCDNVVDIQQIPCLTDPGDPSDPDACFDGFRSCVAGVPSGQCVATDSNAPPLDGLWCETYQSCAATPGFGDPFSCTIQQSQAGPLVERCQLRMKSAGELCPGRAAFVTVNAAGNVGCTYTVVGGIDQQDYRIGFLQGGDAIGGTHLECLAQISANPFPSDLWPGNASVTIRYTNNEGAGTDLEVQLQIEAAVVEDCGSLPGLLCDTWTNTLSSP